MEKILEVNDLTKIFSRRGQPDIIAVDHISFDLDKGGCLGIIGESGSGKSTAAHMITRLTYASGGEIILDGENITRAEGRSLRKAYRRMQMVFQTPAASFDPRRTLGDGIGESLENTGMSRRSVRDRVSELLFKCGLSADFAGLYPH